jgi:predicted acetyltransferase
MARLVDVEAALSGLVTTADERVVVRVRDARYGWNDRAFELSAADGRTTCQPIDAGARATAAPRPAGGEVTVDVDALSRLVVGARSATALSELGGVAGDDDAISRLNELLPTETTEPYLREFF